MQKTISIGRQFNGPPNSANGGYSIGTLALGLAEAGYVGAVEASLHAPPPLETSMVLEASTAEAALRNGDARVGSAKAATLALDVPDLPAAPRLVGTPDAETGAFTPFNQCFVCGDKRHAGDGLCLHAETVDGHAGMVAAPWQLHSNFVDADGNVDPIYIWSALDCPGYFACSSGEAALLGRLTGEIIKPLKASGDAMVFGWSLDDPAAPKGRKRRCGTAVVDAGGEVVAKAEGLWITIDPKMLEAD